MHAIASQIGNVVQIQTKSGAIFEGIFYTVSPHFEIVLQLVHRIEVPGYSVNSTLLTSQTSNNTSSGNNGKFRTDNLLPLCTSFHIKQNIFLAKLLKILLLLTSSY